MLIFFVIASDQKNFVKVLHNAGAKMRFLKQCYKA